MEKVYEIYIRTTPERLWQAITDGEIRRKYSFGVTVKSDWTAGSRYEALAGNAHPISEGENLEVEPPHKLVQTFHAVWGDDVKAAGTSRVTWQIESIADDSCRLVVTHDQLPESVNAQIYGGWPMILSGLKTWLETGEELTTPGSLMYTDPGAWN